MSKSLVIGCGQVGSAIQKVLECDGYDTNSGGLVPLADVIHICFGYSDTFEEEVRLYRQGTDAQLVVIHSTVPVGTSAALNAVHSPVRGKHPDLERSVRTFTKFFGGPKAEEAAAIFQEKGVKTICTPKSETTEAMKLFDTEQYHLNILMEKAIYAFCQEHSLDFDVVYTLANVTYNEGYYLLGMPWFSKYVLKHEDGPIGGHCVVPNSKLLSLLDLINEK